VTADASSASRKARRDARGGLLRRVLLRVAAAGVAVVTVIVVGATAYTVSQPPVVEYSGLTSVLNFTVGSQDQVVWNLPGKTLRSQKISDDGEPVETETTLGLGPLVMPRGTSVQVIRLPGEALHVRFLKIGAQSPFLLTGSGPEPITIHKGDSLTISRGGRRPPDADPECRTELPPMMFRGTGAIAVGAPLNLDAYDMPDVLARIPDTAFIDRMVQPQLLSGEIALFAHVVTGGGVYQADEIKLQPGDRVRFDEKDDARRDAASAPIFVLQVQECDAITVRVVQTTREALLVRIGGDATRVAIQPWQIITKDGVISILATLAGVATALIGAAANVRQLLDANAARPAGEASTETSTRTTTGE